MASTRICVLMVLVVAYLTETDGFMQFHRGFPFNRGIDRYYYPYRSAYDYYHWPSRQFDGWDRQTYPWGRLSDPWRRQREPVSMSEAEQRRRPVEMDRWDRQSSHTRQTDLRLGDPWGRETDRWGRQHDPWTRRTDQTGRQTDQWGRQSDPWGRQDFRNNQASQWGRQMNTGRREQQVQQPEKNIPTPASSGPIPRRLQQPTPPVTEVTRLKVAGYDPEDIQIFVLNDGNIKVKGLHQCSCQENCFQKEFERKIQLPRGYDYRTLKAKISDDNLILMGIRQRAPVMDDVSETTIPVEGNGRTSNTRGGTQLNCGGLKQGLKLKKMDAVTRQVIDDVPVDVIEHKYEGELDGDGVTIEVDG